MKTLLVIAALVVSLNGFAENKSDNFVYNDVYNTQNMVSARTVYRSMDSSSSFIASISTNTMKTVVLSRRRLRNGTRSIPAGLGLSVVLFLRGQNFYD